jgi:ankyrin repeat protein
MTIKHQKEFVKAVYEDDELTMRRLLEEGLVIYNLPIYLGEDLPSYPLCIAAFYGSFKGINLITDYGADINYDEDCYRPLKWALFSSYANVDAIRLLLDRGATSPYMIEDLFNYERPRHEVEAILHFMLRKKIITQIEVIQIILGKFFDVSLDLFTVLFAITKNPNIVNKYGDTVLFPLTNVEIGNEANLHNRLQIIKGLIELGVDPTIKNNYGIDALEYSSHEDIKKLLLEHIPK